MKGIEVLLFSAASWHGPVDPVELQNLLVKHRRGRSSLRPASLKQCPRGNRRCLSSGLLTEPRTDRSLSWTHSFCRRCREESRMARTSRFRFTPPSGHVQDARRQPPDGQARQAGRLQPTWMIRNGFSKSSGAPGTYKSAFTASCTCKQHRSAIASFSGWETCASASSSQKSRDLQGEHLQMIAFSEPARSFNCEGSAC